MLSESRRPDWLAGRWVPMQAWRSNRWVVRRIRYGTTEDRHGRDGCLLTFPTEAKAQKFADKLNAKQRRPPVSDLPSGKVLFRWTPPPGFAEYPYEDVADEYAVVRKDGDKLGRIFTVTYARFGKAGWVANPQTRPLIRELLRRLAEKETTP